MYFVLLLTLTAFLVHMGHFSLESASDVLYRLSSVCSSIRFTSIITVRPTVYCSPYGPDLLILFYVQHCLSAMIAKMSLHYIFLRVSYCENQFKSLLASYFAPQLILITHAWFLEKFENHSHATYIVSTHAKPPSILRAVIK